jgi:hypothetical protein
VSGVGFDEYWHPATGCMVPVPPPWERVEDPQPGVALIAREPEAPAGFQANLVVTVDQIPADLDLDGWQAANEELLGTRLRGYCLLDRESMEVAGRPVLRRLAHHARPDAGSITMEQWATVEGVTGYTLTASVATLSYDSLAEMFAEIARRFRPGIRGKEGT